MIPGREFDQVGLVSHRSYGGCRDGWRGMAPIRDNGVGRVRSCAGYEGRLQVDSRCFAGPSPWALARCWRSGPERAGCTLRTGRAQKFGPDSSGQAEKLLINAANLAQDRQWSEAINIYQRVIDQYGDKVVLLPKDKAGGDGSGDFGLYVDDRRFCHAAIAQLPPEARADLSQSDRRAGGRWFQQGASRRDLGLLRRVVDQAFCSSWGDDALELLGDLAFQEGRFGEALAMYGRLVADRPAIRCVLVHPDPSVDLARVAAKKMLCRAAAGEKPPGKGDLDEFARRYPGAAGALAGRKGPYAEILAESLAADHLAPPPQPDSRWPTFAGSLSRSKVVASPIDVGSTQWRVELDKVGMTRQTTFLPRSGGDGSGPRFARATAGVPSHRAGRPGDRQ